MDRIGPYVVEGRLGQGSIGEVVRARDPRTGQALAIKTLALGNDLTAEARDEALRRFGHEALAAGRLRHPDIVAVLGSGEADGLAWMAMELVPGRDLSQCAAPGRLLPVVDVLHIGARVAEALAYAHGQGVLHRDIKPANVVVDLVAGSVKVTDFGIARLADAARTRTGLMLGTPSFMSPEQIAGQRLDGRSDLYSLGVSLFQLLCGHLPHEAGSMAALMRQIAQAPAPDLRSLRPELPEALAEVIGLTLEKSRERRPADGRQLALSLRAIGDGLAPS